MITFDEVKNSTEIRTYIEIGNKVLGVIGFTEHSFQHATKVSTVAANILHWLGYNEREQELAKIAGYIHDIGNVVNRIDHAQSGAVMAFRILDKMGMEPKELADVVGAVGNHDEGTGTAINPISAALILADKTDVRRSRVRNQELHNFDIHDRVNYAVEKAQLRMEGNEVSKETVLALKVDTNISPVMNYFEIFLSRMLMCGKAAEFLGIKFGLEINGISLL